MPVPTLIIAGTHSGSGKTTVTLAVLAALVRRGLRVQGFKVGPDFIDPGHHSRITGRTSRNLDTWLLDPEALGRTFRKGAEGAEIAIVEGVMGLFDGRGTSQAGSTADLARLWDLPTVLVVDARGLSRSIAPLVLGFARFEESVRVAAVVANRVGSPRHYAEYLAPSLKANVPEVAAVGYLRRDEALAIPSRHLGLLTSDEFASGSKFLEALADAAEATLELDRLLAIARVPMLPPASTDRGPSSGPSPRRRVALARDRAFCFYYEDNLDALREAGGEIVPFSPLDDAELPSGTDLLYLGGGYPEVFAERLSRNQPMSAAIRRYHLQGGAILAECGGLLACTETLRDHSGRTFPLWGLVPARAVMHSRHAALGYVTVSCDRPTPLGPPGMLVRGHEFHFSTLEPRAALRFVTSLHRPGHDPRPDGIRIGGLLAGYAHLHFGSNPAVAANLIGSLTTPP